MVRDKMIVDIAKEQSQAVNNMKPNITIWQNGQKDGSKGSLSGVVEDLVTSAVPLVQAVKKTTGIDLLQSYRQKDSKSEN